MFQANKGPLDLYEEDGYCWPMGETLYDLDADGIATITIDNPKRRNAMTYPMIEQLYEGLRRAADEARVVIIMGQGDAFCSGIDLNFLAEIPPMAMTGIGLFWHISRRASIPMTGLVSCFVVVGKMGPTPT